MPERNAFRGVSTVDSDIKRSNFKLYDEDLIKRDILNMFHTRYGERLMLGNFGTKIWDLLFEPFTPDVKSDVINDVKRVIKSEPRVEIISMNVTEYDKGIKIDMLLMFNKLRTQQNMSIMFDKNALELNR